MSDINRWYAKRSNPETVVGIYATKEEASAKVDSLNTNYQTNDYYVEAWDAEKASQWPTIEQILKISKEISEKRNSSN